MNTDIFASPEGDGKDELSGDGGASRPDHSGEGVVPGADGPFDSPPDGGDLDRDPESDILSEDDLRDLGIDPNLVPVLCPWAVELTGHGGLRCWTRADLAPLLGGTP